MEKIILYYKFQPVSDPEAVRLWQKALCAGLGLRGRIIISDKGINGTLGGQVAALKKYINETKTYFRSTEFKWSEGGASDFPKLSVKVRSEIVTFEATEELKVGASGVIGGGQHLKPNELHELIKRYGSDVVFFDGRNAYEAAIGKFKNAVVPNTKTSKDFVAELDSGKYDHLKDKHVVTYCTGGIRCEILSPLMVNRGFKHVYQMDGGIAKYGEKYGDSGFWEGSLFVFDGRMSMKFSSRAKDIGQCFHCGSKTSNYENCALKTCNKLFLVCERCKLNNANLFHSESCFDLVVA
jgi:UPF0176 protein